MSITRTIQLFGFEKPCNQVVFEAIGFGIIDEARFSASLDIGKGILQRSRIIPLALSFLLHLLSNPSHAPDWGERQREQAGDQAHTGSPVNSTSTNE
jgi:hypothetical protein